jgi:hypothetical protein
MPERETDMRWNTLLLGLLLSFVLLALPRNGYACPA